MLAIITNKEECIHLDKDYKGLCQNEEHWGRVMGACVCVFFFTKCP